MDEQTVREALRQVQAPYMEMDVLAADMIRQIDIRGDAVSIAVDVPLPINMVRESLAAEMERVLRAAIPGAGGITIDVRMAIPGQESPQKTALLPGVKNTVAVASGKGGVGKSTIAVNLAVALARGGARVGLIDADIYGPSIPMMMGISDQPRAYVDNGRTRLLPCDNYGVKVMSIGFLVDPDTAVIWRGPMASGALKQFLTDVDWGDLDYLLFDMPPGTGDIQLTLSQSLPLNGAVIVTTPQDISLADARKGVRMFEKVSVPILGIVENMSYHICPQCGHRDEIFSYGGGREAAREMNVPFIGEIPIQTRVREGGDRGVPIVELDPDSPLAASFVEAAMSLAGRIARGNLTSAPPPRIDIAL